MADAASLRAWLLSPEVAIFADEADLRERAAGLLDVPSFAALAALDSKSIEEKCSDIVIVFDLLDKIQARLEGGGSAGEPESAPSATAAAPAALTILPMVDLVSASAAAPNSPAQLASRPRPRVSTNDPPPYLQTSPAANSAKSLDDFDEMKTALLTSYPHVDTETVVDMLVTHGEVTAVSDLLATHPKERPSETNASPNSQKKHGLVSGIKKKNPNPKVLPNERAPDHERVFKKLKAMKDFKRNDDSELSNFAKVLVTPLLLSETYFPKNSLADQFKEPLPKDEIDAAKTQFGDNFENRVRRMWRVKLILTSLNLNSVQRAAGRLKTWQFGMVHAAVQVGPVILEWNSASLVIPTPMSDYVGSHALLALDLGMLPQDTGFVDPARILDLCRTICRWNSNYSYSVVSKNCQHFVMEVVKALGLPAAKIEGELEQFIAQLRRGHDEHKVEFTYKGKVFNSHSQLDNFVSGKTEQLSPDDYSLLKAYDRAFWIRYRTLVNITDTLSAEEEEMFCLCKPFDLEKCPFGDPEKTGTVMQ